jgi:hypothetical protein
MMVLCNENKTAALHRTTTCPQFFFSLYLFLFFLSYVSREKLDCVFGEDVGETGCDGRDGHESPGNDKKSIEEF